MTTVQTEENLRVFEKIISEIGSLDNLIYLKECEFEEILKKFNNKERVISRCERSIFFIFFIIFYLN
jgi:hypothetical protein